MAVKGDEKGRRGVGGGVRDGPRVHRSEKRGLAGPRAFTRIKLSSFVLREVFGVL